MEDNRTTQYRNSDMSKGYSMNPGNGWSGYGDENNAPSYQQNESARTLSNQTASTIGGTQGMNYYQEYCKLFVANVVLTNQIKELIAEKNDMLSKISRIEKKGEDVPANVKSFASASASVDQEEADRKKRARRTASEIERNFVCPAGNCGKSYGSEGALLQHVRLKHPDMVEDVKAKLSK
mmetsp:Transcript_28440/g.32892  ORF Transcript_28440/g.32892 Transcript_28440/m.32892 type:complete len:180 (-) Transcript_28440:51-590(-)